jgi:hypothetical protein
VGHPGAFGVWPLRIGRHNPAAPDTLHDRQGPLHSATSQQTPSTQDFELQSMAVAQAAPSGFAPHEPPLQVCPALQSAAVWQVVLQSPFAQT